VAVVGATGAGKTTIINLLERFYDPGAGQVLLDGNEVRKLDLRWLRSKVGLVMQDVFIIPGTIRENILLDQDLGEERLAKIVSQAQLHRLVGQLPQGLDTRIGEGGLEISAGQRQLLAFARVLARDPRILILDEATSNVDTESEVLIERAIAETLANRTSIVIAHRLSTIRRAERILVLARGRLMEQGTHEELRRRKGLYYRMLNSQSLAPEADKLKGVFTSVD
jgi:ATP-binding cassette subfamily B protein